MCTGNMHQQQQQQMQVVGDFGNCAG
jgi:hypothetical protein